MRVEELRRRAARANALPKAVETALGRAADRGEYRAVVGEGLGRPERMRLGALLGRLGYVARVGKEGVYVQWGQ